MRVAAEIKLTMEEREALEKLIRSGRTQARVAQRARIVLLASGGMQNKAIAAKLGVGRVQVGRWRERYAQSRLAGIERDLPRGAPEHKVDTARLVELTTQSTPRQATHWSTRTMPWASVRRASRGIGVPKDSVPCPSRYRVTATAAFSRS